MMRALSAVDRRAVKEVREQVLSSVHGRRFEQEETEGTEISAPQRVLRYSVSSVASCSAGGLWQAGRPLGTISMLRQGLVVRGADVRAVLLIVVDVIERRPV